MTNAKFYELKRAINLGALTPAQAVELFDYAERLRNLLREDIDGCGLWFPSEEVLQLVGLPPSGPPIQSMEARPGIRALS
jgi:hypothetical protein